MDSEKNKIINTNINIETAGEKNTKTCERTEESGSVSVSVKQELNENRRRSIWSRTTETEERTPLPGDREVDVAVIGGGMAGLLTAYLLQQKGHQAIVLEAARIGSGQTKNTTAKITSQHGLIYDKLTRKYGFNDARLYARANEEAIGMYEKIIGQKQIDCDFQRLPSYLYSTQDREILQAEARAAARLGLPASFRDSLSLPFDTVGAVCFEHQAQFHPLKFLSGIAKELEIYERTMVYSVRGHKLYTNHGTVTARYIVFAVHYPFPVISGFYFARQHQERSYAIAYSGVKQLDGMYYSIDDKGLSLRSYKDLLIIGGSGHRTGRKETGGSYALLREQAEKYFPEGEETASWSAQDCISHDMLPFIGAYSWLHPYWYVATGFKKWGMTFSMISAMMISDTICGVEYPYQKVFTPRRWHPITSARTFFLDLGISVKGLLTGYHFFTNAREADLNPGHGGIVRRRGRRYGCYRDLQGEIHRVTLRCPHMGCELLWNPDELSWDCPCHGSRFDYDGNLIDNPAQKHKKDILE